MTNRAFALHRVIQDVGRRSQRRHDAGPLPQGPLALATVLLLADFARPAGTQNLVLHRLDDLRQLAPHALRLVETEQVPALARGRFARVLSDIASAARTSVHCKDVDTVARRSVGVVP